MYITALSFGLVAGIGIHCSDIDMDAGTSLLFVGGFLTALGLNFVCIHKQYRPLPFLQTGVLALWPWYKTDTNCYGYAPINAIPPPGPPRTGWGFVTEGVPKTHPRGLNFWLIPYIHLLRLSQLQLSDTISFPH